MKPPPFAYHRARSTDDALAALAAAGSGGKVLAGGQSLIPLMNMRLAAPDTLVDINAVHELASIDVTSDAVRVGARVRHAELERHAGARAACPLLAQALAHVAHPVIRNRGTVVGSLAHADPAGELTAVLALLGGELEIARAANGTTHRRTATAADFFLGPLEADLRAGDLVTAATLPLMPATTGSSFVEVARRHGDYALCGIAALTDVRDGEVASARVAAISIHPTPLVVDVTSETVGARAAEADWTAAADKLASAAEPEADLHASADYRRHLARVLTARALSAAAAHATEREGVRV